MSIRRGNAAITVGLAASIAIALPIAKARAQDAACARVGAIFDDLAKRKTAGLTEADALADLAARGDYSLGYVVDGVFGNRFGPGGSAMARHDVMLACARIASGGELY